MTRLILWFSQENFKWHRITLDINITNQMLIALPSTNQNLNYVYVAVKFE